MTEEKKLRIQQYELNPKRCLCCDSALPYEKRGRLFCGRSCSTKQHNKFMDYSFTNRKIRSDAVFELVDWNKIQQEYNSGTLVVDIYKKYGFSSTVLDRAVKLGDSIEKKRSYIK